MKIYLSMFFFIVVSIQAEKDSVAFESKRNDNPTPPAIEQEKEREPVIRRRRRKPQLSKQEQDFINRRFQETKSQKKKNDYQGKRSTNLPMGKVVKKSSTTEKMKLEVVDQPITNLFKMISKTYKLNIVPEADLNTIRVTINLENISVTEGLQVICNANGLEMVEVENVIYIKRASAKAITEMK